MCLHCDDAPCKQVCPVNAIAFQHDAVYLNETLSMGCTRCGLVCPFEVITLSDSHPLAAPSRYQYFISDAELRDVPDSPLTPLGREGQGQDEGNCARAKIIPSP
ncbi:4Fe-4S dicluster domain-containing protein [Yokenella regensburgei]|uniref:4Fe-4S dicluster domain-containing protein n=1 Tax=Yokenella regensburgei TaxID=158877 RepID=UPI003F5CC3B9